MLTARKAWALLAYLALPPGRMHPRDKLTALLWGGAPETQARASLRQALSTLRRGLGDGLLVQKGDGLALSASQVDTVPSARIIHLTLQTHEVDARHRPVGPYAGPTADRRVRAAVTAALDVDEVVRQVLGGRAVRLAGLMTPYHVGFDPGLRPSSRDPARATQLLAAAGLPQGVDLVLNTPQGRYLRDREVAEALAGQLTRAGLRTTIRAHEWGTFLSQVYGHRAGPLWLSGWGAATLDPETVYAPLFRTGSPLSSYHNPEIDRLIDEASTSMDEGTRLTRYERVGRLLLDDVAVIPLYQPMDLYGVSRRLGWRPRPDEAIRADEMAIVQGR